LESVQFEAETRAVSIGKPCRSLRKRHATVSGIDVPSERNLQTRVSQLTLTAKILSQLAETINNSSKHNVSARLVILRDYVLFID